MSTEHVDIIRWFAIVLGCFLASLTVALVILHWQNYVAAKSQVRPRHVVTISITFMATIAWAMFDTIQRFGQPITWRAPTLIIILLVSVYDLTAMLESNLQRRLP